MDMSIGLRIYTSGGLSFFCTQILGIVVEDAVMKVYSTLTGAKRSHSPPRPSTVQQAIGFAWVCGFLVWTLPAYMYPLLSLNCDEGNHAIVPVSVIGMWKGVEALRAV
jgi:hypothetical protein